jgi:lysophospholipase L1-like esterase
MQLRIKKNETVLFIGDSITDCGKSDVDSPLGNGYVKMFRDLMISREPSKNITILNKGIGGNRISDLQARWNDDVLCHQPDWLSIMIGVNDLSCRVIGGSAAPTINLFEQMYDDILSKAKERLPDCRILLLDPFFIATKEPHVSEYQDSMLKLIPSYITVVHKMSQKYKTLLVKTHDVFQKLLQYHKSEIFCPEPVHPNITGHLMIAEAVANSTPKRDR